MPPVMSLMLGLILLPAGLFALAQALELVPASSTDVRKRLTRSDRLDPEGAAAGILPRDRTSLGVWKLVASAASIKTMERNLSVAGKAPDAVRTLLKIKVFAPLAVLFVGWLQVSSMSGVAPVLVLAVAVVLAYSYPNIYCTSRATEMKAQMLASLPDVLDQLTIALDAGMSFEAAFARVGTTHRGPLGPQISRTVQDMAVGMPRREAYLAMAERNGIDDLSQLMRSLVQAEEFGVPIAQVVRLQADEMRDKRRQRAAAKAQTVPLKLMFPMMACLLPVMFIVLLTPAVVGIGKVL